MKYISWKKIKSWSCITCGDCCKRFRIPLKGKEYVNMYKIFGGEIFDFNSAPGRVFIKRKTDGSCIFQHSLFGRQICGIQDIKPIVCKLFPFLISKSNDKKALYIYKGNPYNIYLTGYCRGITLGKPSFQFRYKTIPLAIEENLKPEKSQHRLTSKIFSKPLLNV